MSQEDLQAMIGGLTFAGLYAIGIEMLNKWVLPVVMWVASFCGGIWVIVFSVVGNFKKASEVTSGILWKIFVPFYFGSLWGLPIFYFWYVFGKGNDSHWLFGLVKGVVLPFILLSPLIAAWKLKLKAENVSDKKYNLYKKEDEFKKLDRFQQDEVNEFWFWYKIHKIGLITTLCIIFLNIYGFWVLVINKFGLWHAYWSICGTAPNIVSAFLYFAVPFVVFTMAPALFFIPAEGILRAWFRLRIIMNSGKNNAVLKIHNSLYEGITSKEALTQSIGSPEIYILSKTIFEVSTILVIFNLYTFQFIKYLLLLIQK